MKQIQPLFFIGLCVGACVYLGKGGGVVSSRTMLRGLNVNPRRDPPQLKLHPFPTILKGRVNRISCPQLGLLRKASLLSLSLPLLRVLWGCPFLKMLPLTSPPLPKLWKSKSTGSLSRHTVVPLHVCFFCCSLRVCVYKRITLLATVKDKLRRSKIFNSLFEQNRFQSGQRQTGGSQECSNDRSSVRDVYREKAEAEQGNYWWAIA